MRLTYLGLTQEMFDIRYGNPIIIGNMEFEVVAQPLELQPGESYAAALTHQLATSKPDVVQATGMAVPLLVEDNLLWPVETVLDVNTDGFAPSIIQKIRDDSGDGFLYGLPTMLMSDVLYYNKALFDQVDLPYPTNGMSWPEVLELDRQLWSRMTLRGDGGAYSLLEPGNEEPAAKLDRLIRAYGMSEGIADMSNGEVALDTTQWLAVWQDIINAYTSYRYSKRSEHMLTDYGNRELSFLNQSSPLMIGGSYYWHNWHTSESPDFDWGFVTTPGATNIYYQYELLAVSSASDRKDAAWKLIESLTSKETTDRLLTETDGSHPYKGFTGRFPARIAQMEEKRQIDLSALYIQAPARKGLYVHSSDPVALPTEFHNDYSAQRINYIQDVLDGRLTVQSALAQLQRETEALLTRGK